jgi:hypothetical protein
MAATTAPPLPRRLVGRISPLEWVATAVVGVVFIALMHAGQGVRVRRHDAGRGGAGGRTVLVWCQAFSVEFVGASLTI